MHTQVYRKLLLRLSVIGVAVSIVVGFYDVIFHFLMECLHLAFEMVESMLDKLVEHSFETELHETQLIVFYIIVAIGSFLIYLIWRFLVHVCKDFNLSFKSEWLELKTAASLDWQALSMAERLVYIGLFILVNYLLSFLLF